MRELKSYPNVYKFVVNKIAEIEVEYECKFQRTKGELSLAREKKYKKHQRTLQHYRNLIKKQQTVIKYLESKKGKVNQ